MGRFGVIVTVMSRLSLALALGASALLASGCGGETTCSLAACEHEALVTFPTGLVSAGYDLTLVFADGSLLSARCSDPGAPELADNPEGLSCDAAGFALIGEPAAGRSVSVTITDADSGDIVVGNVEVRLDAVDEFQPNGPGCPPTCFVRNGQLTMGGQ